MSVYLHDEKNQKPFNLVTNFLFRTFCIIFRNKKECFVSVNSKKKISSLQRVNSLSSKDDVRNIKDFSKIHESQRPTSQNRRAAVFNLAARGRTVLQKTPDDYFEISVTENDTEHESLLNTTIDQDFEPNETSELAIPKRTRDESHSPNSEKRSDSSRRKRA